MSDGISIKRTFGDRFCLVRLVGVGSYEGGKLDARFQFLVKDVELVQE